MRRDHSARKVTASHVWWRTFLCGLCIFLSVTALLGSVFTRYVRDNYLNTERYVEMVAPLPANPQVATALGTFAADRLFDATNAQVALAEFLPPKLAPLAAPLSQSLQKHTAELSATLLQADEFTMLWTNANEQAHTILMRVVHGEITLEQHTSTELVLNLAELLGRLREHLGVEQSLLKNEQQDAFAQLRVDLHQSVADMRRAVNVVTTAAWLLPLLAVLFFAAGVLAARNRRRALMATGAIIASLAALLLVAFKIFFIRIEQEIATPVYQSAAHEVIEALYGDLRARLLLLFLAGVLLWFGGLLYGPSPWAVWLRAEVAMLWRCIHHAKI